MRQKLRISPDAAFSVTDWTAFVIFMVVIGGVGTLEGPILGALVFFVLRQFLADLGGWYLILLGGVAVITMLVEVINNRKHAGETETSVFGPFWVDGAPELPMGSALARDGRVADLLVEGRVHAADGTPIAGALLDVWQTAPNGFYDVQDAAQPPMNFRGRFRTGADGSYHFRTVQPSSYPIPHDGTVGNLLDACGRHPWRPSHLHFMITAEGYRRLITALYFDGDPYLDSDAVFGVKDSLVVRPVPNVSGGARVSYAFGPQTAQTVP
jgi:catechol 1,2-dioxygenase